MMFSKILWTPDDATKVDLSIAPSVSLFLAEWLRPRRRSTGAGARSVPSKGGANKKAADENKKGVNRLKWTPLPYVRRPLRLRLITQAIVMPESRVRKSLT